MPCQRSFALPFPSLSLSLCFFLRLFLPSRVIPFGIIILCEEWLHYLFSPYEKCAHLCRSAATVKYIIQSHSRSRGGGGGRGEREEEEKEMEPEVNIAYTPSVPASDFTLRLFMHLTIETFVQHVWHICAPTHTHTHAHIR